MNMKKFLPKVKKLPPPLPRPNPPLPWPPPKPLPPPFPKEWMTFMMDLSTQIIPNWEKISRKKITNKKGETVALAFGNDELISQAPNYQLAFSFIYYLPSLVNYTSLFFKFSFIYYLPSIANYIGF